MLSVVRHCGVGRRAFKELWKDEGAAVGTEYVLLLGVLTMGMALAALALGENISLAINGFTDVLSQSECAFNGTGFGDGSGSGDGQGAGSGAGNTC